jgi:hypothetical protein
MIIVLAKCRYRVLPSHPMKILEFIDETGTQVQIPPSPEAAASLAKDLTGIEVARDMPSGNGHSPQG